jgi:signal transduction histidine kinase
MRRFFAPIAHGRVYRHTAHLLIDLLAGTVFFTFVVTAVSTSIGLAITFFGLPLLAATIFGGRIIAACERWRARVFLGDDPPAPTSYRLRGSWSDKAKQAFGDKPGWKGLAYGVVMLPWGVLTFTVAVTLWSVLLALITGPIWLALPYDEDDVLNGGWRVAAAIGGVMVGVLLVGVVPRVIGGLAELDRRLIRGLLSPTREDQLVERVETLQASRDASVEGSASELRRIERDLHDGAQQRLVSLAMHLGLAKEQLERANDGDATADPRPLELVTAAHDEAKQAIGELRDLVRGIHPAVLTDRGLDAAVSALAARCPVPVVLRSELNGPTGPRRFPPAVEAAAYFIVAEALTNVAKHSHARSASVGLREVDGRLVVEITDDGVGGAVEGTDGGLRNLRDRVAGAEGRLRIASPEGGPTAIVAELPCES